MHEHLAALHNCLDVLDPEDQRKCRMHLQKSHKAERFDQRPREGESWSDRSVRLGRDPIDDEKPVATISGPPRMATREEVEARLRKSGLLDEGHIWCANGDEWYD